ncbi:hypothetical protein J7K07_03845 [Candidatus Bathyarchaeota archaeon]|nr:hypothetical protein [Candidatus Bathyarchaeota archaeon]
MRGINDLRRIDEISSIYSLFEASLTRREFLLGALGLALVSSLSSVQRPLSVLSFMVDPRKVDEVLSSNGKLPVYSNEIDWMLNEKALKSLPLPVERVTDPSGYGQLLVLGGPEAREDEYMPRNLVKELYAQDEVKLLRRGKWTVKAGEVDGIKIVNVAGGDRYLTERGIDFLLGEGRYASDYNSNETSNLEEIASGRNPLEKKVSAYVTKVSTESGVEVRVHVDHPLPVVAYYSLSGVYYKMFYSDEGGYYYRRFSNSEIGRGLTIDIVVSDMIDGGKCLYSNSKHLEVTLKPTTTTSEERTESESETRTETQTERKDVVIRLNVPYRRQINWCFCKVASYSMATAYLGDEITQREFENYIKEKTGATDVCSLPCNVIDPLSIELVEKRGFKIRKIRVYHGTTEGIEEAFWEALGKYRLPAIVPVKKAHSGVATGIDTSKKVIYAHDPICGPNQTMSYSKDPWSWASGPYFSIGLVYK